MLFIEITEVEFTGGHIRIILILEFTKTEFTGSHIGICYLKRLPKWN